MKVRLTKFVDTETIRFRLQAVVEVPCDPKVGWFLSGYTNNPTIELVVAKVGFVSFTQIVECILVQERLGVLDGDKASEHLGNEYGCRWDITWLSK